MKMTGPEEPGGPKLPGEGFLNRLGTCGAALSAIDIGVITLILVAGVAMRFLGSVIAGTFDLVETFVVVIGAFGFVYCEIQDRHTKADIIVNHFSFRTRSRCEALTTFLTLGFWCVLLYSGWTMLTRMYEEGEATDVLKINVVPFRALWVLATLLMCVVLVFKLFHRIRDAFSNNREKG